MTSTTQLRYTPVALSTQAMLFEMAAAEQVNLMVTKYAEEQGGADTAGQISFFSPDLIGSFFANAGEWLSGFDLVWIGLAVVTAWGIPKPGGLGSLMKKAA